MQLISHIILMLEGFSAFLDETCDADCDDLTSIGDWRIEKIECNETNLCFPSVDQLQRFCPQTIEFLDCKSKVIETCEELAYSPNTNLSILTKYSMNTENLVRELCNENSLFYKDYVSQIKCYKEMYSRITDTCWKLLDQTKSEFIEYLDLTDKTIPNEVNCLMIDYHDACLADKFKVFCGKSAQKIFLKTQRVLKGIFSLDCSEVDEEYTSNFFTFLDTMWKLAFNETFRIV